MHLTPAIGLGIDTLSTLLCQCGYVVQKLGHHSVEAANTKLKPGQPQRSGFFTLRWLTGFIISLIAGIGHACK